jgi:hypothetical protein
MTKYIFFFNKIKEKMASLSNKKRRSWKNKREKKKLKKTWKVNYFACKQKLSNDKISLAKKHFEERKKFAKKEGRVRIACYLSHYL